MTRRFIALMAAAAAFAVFGGLHLEASGRGLDRHVPGDARLLTNITVASGINRSVKSDRTLISTATAESRTITFQHPDLPATTVAVHVWETARAKGPPVAKDRQAPVQKRKQAVACEGAVSVLTEVAKQLDAARCVT